MATKEKSQDFFPMLKGQTKDTEIQALKEFFLGQIRDLKEEFEQKYNTLRQEFCSLFHGMSKIMIQADNRGSDLISELDARVTEIDSKIISMDNKVQMIEKELLISQFKSKELAIRLRGVAECKGEDLRANCADVLAPLSSLTSTQVLSKFDKAYRVNSKVAQERQLPRDVVIYFTDRNLRNEILKKSFVSPIQFKGRKVIIFKELPPKMLQDRKNFAFLTTELKKQQIKYRWDVPFGLILWFHGKNYHLDTLEKAQVFYSDILMVFLSEASVSVDKVKKMVSKMESQEEKMDPQQRQQNQLQQQQQQQQQQLQQQAVLEKQIPQQLQQEQMLQPPRIKGAKNKQYNKRKHGKK